MGDILGLQTTSIDFVYTPKSFSTAEAEIQIRTTEFDSQPKTIRITGSAAPGAGMTVAMRSKVSGFSGSKYEHGTLNVIQEEDVDYKPNQSRMSQGKTLLQARETRQGGGPIRLEKIPGRDTTASLMTKSYSKSPSRGVDSKNQSKMMTMQEGGQQTSILANLKTVKLSNDE